MASLLPGYKHVESFGPDSEYEEEEVEYVTLDLGTVEPTLVPSSSSYRLIGLDTPTPFLQLSGTMLKGEHVSLLGTELLFSEASAAGSSSGMNTGVDEQPHERTQGKKTLVHLANTERRIRFKEVELKPKVTGSSSNGEDVGTPTPKTANLAKKVKTQMEHVMSGSAGPSRRGRGRGGGRKRGSTSGKPKASSARSKTRDADQDEEGAPAADSAEKEGGEAGQDDNADSAPVQMDTSAG
ncbi:hypothetical protein GSI_05332 [Ganoderma sinense ZZ0214-1]|uniref:Transcription factor TFIIIC triple barrel domain-containing protein n=1 Tax=Ganoderma sinense ZZ0214-1 TaxID=1077348 RepID=A0A2G8SGB7_9APHY|nr:hypothetical protein GSI_05332 [Ganoderma sinense ZZ0214-1]